MAKLLRLALIGAAHPHVDYVLDEVARRDDVEIVALLERDGARRARLRERAPAPVFDDLDALIADARPDIAAVVTEPGLRGPIVLRLIEAGVFALVDKPLATRRAELDAIEAALAGRDRLALMLEKRFYPTTRALREIIAAGELGDLVSIRATGPHKLGPATRPRWYFDAALYGGILTDLAVHDIDLALWLSGETCGRVSGWISPISAEGAPGFPAQGRALVETASGLSILVDGDWIQPASSPRHGDYAMRVSGTKGRADVYFAENRLVVETHDRPAREAPLPAPIGPATFAFDHLTQGAPLAIWSADALRASRVALLAQESAAQNGAWFAFD